MDLSDFACWATGPLPVGGDVPDDPDLSNEPNWGDDGDTGDEVDEFVVDLRDLGNDVLLLMELKAEYLKKHKPTKIDLDDGGLLTRRRFTPSSIPCLSWWIIPLASIIPRASNFPLVFLL